MPKSATLDSRVVTSSVKPPPPPPSAAAKPSSAASKVFLVSKEYASIATLPKQSFVHQSRVEKFEQPQQQVYALS